MYLHYRSRKIHTCHYWQAFFIFMLFLTVDAFAEPGVGIRVTKKGEDCHITVYGVSLGTIKEAKITCEYGSTVEIDKSLIGSLIPNVSIGATIDRGKRQLNIHLLVNGSVNIDSVSLGKLQFPLNGLPDYSTFKLLSASFMNSKGETVDAVILPASSVFKKFVNHRNESKGDHDHILLNGRCIKLQTLKRLEKRALGNCVPVRIFKK